MVVQAPYVPPVAAYDPEMDEDADGGREGFNAAFDVRRLHAAARAKAEAAGDLDPGRHTGAATGDMAYHEDMQQQLYSEEEDISAHDRQVRIDINSNLSS